MCATRSVVRPALCVALSMYGGLVAAQIPDQFRIVRHVVIVDVPRREALFNLWFSETPDFATFNGSAQSHAFQFYLELPEQRNFSRRAAGSPEIEHPLVVARSGEAGIGARAVARVVTPGAANWGPIVATAPMQQLRTRVSFRLPLSIFDTGSVKPYVNNELFAVHYFLQALRFGATTYWPPRGVATVATEAAQLRVQRREVQTGSGSTRVLLIAQVLARPATEERPDSFLPEFVDADSVRFGPNRARPVGNELRDVSGDSHEDLVLTFNATDVGLSCIDRDAVLTGEMASPGNYIPEGTVFIARAARSPQPC